MTPTDDVGALILRVALAVVAGLTAMVLVRRTSLVPAPGRAHDALVVVVTGITTCWVGTAVLTPPTIVLLPLVVLGQAAAVVDIQEKRLPDPLTSALLLSTLVAASGAGAHLIGTLVAAATAGGAALLAKTLSSAAIGWGDVKLAPTVGVVLTHFDVVPTGLWSIALLVLATAVLVAGDRRTRDDGIVPYGPALVLGTLGAVVGR